LKPNYISIFKFEITSWVIAFIAYTFFRIIMALDLKELPFFQTGYPPIVLIALNVFGGVLMGTIMSFGDIFFIRTLKSKHSFGYYLLRKSLIYILTILFVLLVIFGIAVIVLDVPIREGANHFFMRSIFTYMIYCIFVSILIGFIGQVNDKFGPGILFPMFMGKYHHPIEEDKILMFIDLTGSTKFAERLGHIKYSHFIQDFLFDLNVAANQCEGSIYQYVGDEAVVSWDKEEGINNQNCISIFFIFQDIIQEKRDYYISRFGEIPTFKAGANFGRVMVAEVGYLKKEIAYHGDTINTAARIRGLCHQYDKDFLISGVLRDALNGGTNYVFESQGIAELKGKESKVEIFSVERSG
jgi:adenylate cyclase